MQIFGITDRGCVRTENQDSFRFLQADDLSWSVAVLCDGMGGVHGGQVASQLAAELFMDTAAQKLRDGDADALPVLLRESAAAANEGVFKRSLADPACSGMGTTLVVCICTKEFILFGNIGDSSGFVYKDNKLFKVTKDHTLVNLLIATGELSEEDAKFHPKKNVLMKALGAVNPAEVDIFDVENNVDGILLASDGLTNMLSVTQIEGVLKMDISLEDKVKKLIVKSNNRGGTDNISVVLLDCESGGVK